MFSRRARLVSVLTDDNRADNALQIWKNLDVDREQFFISVLLYQRPEK